MKTCANCQAKNDADAKFCSACGKPLAQSSAAQAAIEDPSKINVLVLSAGKRREAVLADSPSALESEIAYLFVIYRRALGMQFSFVGAAGGNRGTSPFDVACAQVDQAKLVLLRVDEGFLASQECLDLSERIVERYNAGEHVRIFPILKKRGLSISQTPFANFSTLMIDDSKSLAESIKLASILLASNNQYTGAMSLYGWLLQVLEYSERRTKEFVVGSLIVAPTGSSWSKKQLTLYRGNRAAETFEFGQITDQAVNSLASLLGSATGSPNFVMGVAR